MNLRDMHDGRLGAVKCILDIINFGTPGPTGAVVACTKSAMKLGGGVIGDKKEVIRSMMG